MLRAAGVTFSVVGSMARDAPFASDLDTCGIERMVGGRVRSTERSPQHFVTSCGPLDVFWVPA